MNKRFSPFTVRLLNRVVLAVILLFSILVALLLLPIVLFAASFLACSLLAIYLLKKVTRAKKKSSEHYDIEIHPIIEEDASEDVPRGNKIERH